ncbi:MAG: redoxin domain-containing protein [Thermoflexales bacterium]|nr:redoxin domain-containing protein [Thermoflexales bacterium]
MAQLRQDYERFLERQAEILVVGPDGPRAFQRTWEKESFPFVGLADPPHTVADLYEQEVNWLKLGRMPAVLLVDKEGHIRYRHHASSMSDIPDNSEILALLDTLN